MTKKQLKVPFDHKGHMMTFTYAKYPDLPGSHYEECQKDDPGARKYLSEDKYYRYVNSGEWRDNYVFHATLTVTGTTRGRSAARINLEDEQGHKYEMFLTDIVDCIMNAPTIAYGMIEADWTFAKRGSNYGVKVVK